ncbi:FAD/NAD(P)-dependent oxidoreductase [Devosia sp. A449]
MIATQSLQALDDHYALIVIGAGPAGMAAAVEASRHGVKTLVLDENAAVGGQIYRAITATTPKRLAILGKDYAQGAKLAQAFTQSNAAYLAKATVWRLSPEREVGVSHDGVSRLITGDRVLVATGAMERPFPIAGWTLPGVMTAGAAQILLKASGAVMGPKLVLAGSGPLLWLLASQYLAAKVPLLAILDTTPKTNLLKALPHLAGFVVSPYFGKGLALMSKVRRSVRVFSNVAQLRAEGDGQLEQVRFTASGKEHILAVDHLLLHQGVVPEVNLLRSVGCDMVWDDEQICWHPIANAGGETSVPGIYVAGDGRAIYGAEAARFSGRRVALELSKSLGAMEGEAFAQACTEVERESRPYLRGRLFLDRMFRPHLTHRAPANDAVACRCEEVMGATLRDTVSSLKVLGPNQLKAFLRCGMGPCQGRQCSLGITETIAEIRGVSPDEVGAYRIRPPVKPVSVGQIANLLSGAQERH